MSKENILDVAIIGGGISGVYSAWRLLNADKKAKIEIFEGSKRIGGRLLSVTPPGMPNVKCELGGMRYMSTQPLVKTLIEKKLKLKIQPFVVDDPNNIAYFRGKHLRQNADLKDPAKVPYNVDWAEQSMSPSDLLVSAVKQILPDIMELQGEQLRERLRTYIYNGKHLYDQGFWNILATILTKEAYDYSQAGIGYDTASWNYNAMDTILLNFDFTPNVEFHALVDGYDSLPQTIADLFKKEGGKVNYGYWLKSFDTEKDSKGNEIIKLAFANGKVVYAKSIVLAMPRRSLELIDQTGPVLGPGNAEVHKLIQSVTPIPLFKVFVCYPYPWWEAVGVTKGRTLTDLPVRQTYYWATEAHQKKGKKENMNSVLLASYDDGNNVDFWAGLRDMKSQKLFETKANNFVSKGDDTDDWDEYKAPEAMVQEVNRQLAEIHGLKYIPQSYAAAYKDWGEDPFGGGVNFWNIHAKSWEVIPAIIRPKKQHRVFICGEAYSNGQGWVEGALETAELMLQKHFKLPAPEWTK